MTITRRSVITALGVAPALTLLPRPAFAAYPDRPVKIVVANTPGGPSYIIARIMAAAMQQTTGGTFIVENRGGAGDRKSTRLNSSHSRASRMPSSA